MDGKELVKQTLDQIPQTNSNAKRIIGLVKEGGRITGYQLSDNSIVEKQQAGKMYVLMDQDQLQAACILETDDDGWYDQRPAFYVHQLVSDPGCPGAGSRLLTEVEALAQREGRCLVRLDCMQTNQALNAFYEKRGYRKVGTCQVGLYEGFQREKRV